MTATLTKTSTPFEIKAVNEEGRTFTGLASTWDLDLGGDVIHKGAFRGSIKDWQKGKKPLPLIDQHNYGSIRSVVGKMVHAKETDEGLLSQFQVIDGPDGDEVLRRVRGGYVDGLSIGYEPVEWEFEEDTKSKFGKIRHLKTVKLHEVSVVIWPMNPNATIDANTVKALIEHMDDKGALRSLATHIGNRVKRLQTNEQPQQPEETPAPAADSPTAPDAPDMSLFFRLKLARLGAKFSAENQHGDGHGSGPPTGARQDHLVGDQSSGEVPG